MADPEAAIPEVCETWCGRGEEADGCQCIGKLRKALAELDRQQASGLEATARTEALRERLRHLLAGRFDPRAGWPGRRD